MKLDFFQIGKNINLILFFCFFFLLVFISFFAGTEMYGTNNSNRTKTKTSHTHSPTATRTPSHYLTTHKCIPAHSSHPHPHSPHAHHTPHAIILLTAHASSSSRTSWQEVTPTAC